MTIVIAGHRQWTTTDDLPKEGWAILKDLLPGHAYHVRVTTNSEQGASVSEIQEIIAGNNPGKIERSVLCHSLRGCIKSMFLQSVSGQRWNQI